VSSQTPSSYHFNGSAAFGKESENPLKVDTSFVTERRRMWVEREQIQDANAKNPFATYSAASKVSQIGDLECWIVDIWGDLTEGFC
jgi:hypothetical protein